MQQSFKIHSGSDHLANNTIAILSFFTLLTYINIYHNIQFTANYSENDERLKWQRFLYLCFTVQTWLSLEYILLLMNV